MRGRKNTEADFWSNVDKTDGCWLWTGLTMGAGYGEMGWQGRTQVAHRISWQIHNGEILSGLNVCHHCDTPACVRPDHLFLGTQRDNVRDAVAKGRHTRMPRRSKEDATRQIAINQPVMRAWHASEAGHQWHSEHALRGWENRKTTAITCQVCGRQHETPFPSRTKFCGPNCKAAALRARRRAA